MHTNHTIVKTINLWKFNKLYKQVRRSFRPNAGACNFDYESLIFLLVATTASAHNRNRPQTLFGITSTKKIYFPKKNKINYWNRPQNQDKG